MYKFGTIVLIPFPFTDLTSTKLRPALIISKTSKNRDDIILCFISSKTPSKSEFQSQYFLSAKDPHFPQTGLKIDSLFRFDKIATLHRKLILGELGFVHQSILKKMYKSFESAFGF